MTRTTRAGTVAATLLAALSLAACAGSTGSPTPSPPDLSGTWLLNPSESETYEDRFGGGPRGGAVSIEEREQMRQEVAIGLRAFRAFKLEQTDSTVTLTAAEGPTRSFHTDGRAVERRIEGLGKVTVTARWDGDKLEVKRRLADGIEIREQYQLADDGRRLRVRFRVSGGARSFDFKRVYEPVRGAGGAG